MEATTATTTAAAAAGATTTTNNTTRAGAGGCARMVTAGWVLGRPVRASAVRVQTGRQAGN
jgi:hypothetical protein